MKEGCGGRRGADTRGPHFIPPLSESFSHYFPFSLSCSDVSVWSGVEQDPLCTQIKPDRVFPPRRQLWDAPALGPVPPLCVWCFPRWRWMTDGWRRGLPWDGRSA